ncbi:MAG: right-handed parallel beta-helix repeat-containing protein [Bryobacterales bacterium]|nr:right-handed parallel beta-helix repeat-containing protein [Bryobacterales bacterium]
MSVRTAIVTFVIAGLSGMSAQNCNQSGTSTCTPADLQACINNPSNTFCRLGPPGVVYSVGAGQTYQPITVSRGNLTLSGYGVYMVLYQTSPRQPLINVNFASNPGITITGFNLWNTGYPNTFGDGPLIRIERADNGAWPASPFSNQGPYSVEMYNNSLAWGQGGSYVESMGILVANASPNRVANLYIHNNYFDHSTVGFFTNGDEAYSSYPACDTAGYPDSQASYQVRNARIEGNHFYNTGQGALVVGMARWIGIRDNTINNDSGVHNSGTDFGGAMFIDSCANRIDIARNIMTGAPSNSLTDGLEIYGRNITITGNTISGFALDGIALHNAADVQIHDNTIRDNNWHLQAGGLHIDNNIPGGRQGGNISLTLNRFGNNSGYSQKYGLRLTDTAGVPIATNISIAADNNFNFGSGNAWRAACYGNGYLPLQGFPQNPQNVNWPYSGTFLPGGSSFPWEACR